MYQYNATVIYVVDGDTLDVEVDLGLDVGVKERLRLYGINAAETSTAEGRAARDNVRAMLPAGTHVILNTFKDKREKYGRYLAEVTLDSGASLNQIVLAMPGSVVYIL